MKLLNRITFILIISFSFLSPIYAKTTLSLHCPSTSTLNSVVTCDVSANSDTELSAISTRLKVSSNLEFVDFKTDASWQGIGDGGNIDLYTYPNQKGKIKLGQATIKILNNSTKTGTISLENTTVYQADFSGTKINNTAVNIKILSTNNHLSSLTVDKFELSPKFNKDTLNYTLSLDSSTVLIKATAEDETATISGTGLKNLQYGENNFVITVTSESGDKKEYHLQITRPNKQEDNLDKSDNNSSKKDEEKKEVPKNNTQESTSEPSTSNHKESQNEESKKIPLLKSLIIEGYPIDFKENTYTYSLELLRKEKSLSVKAIPLDEKTKVTISGNDNLVLGANEIIITLESEDGGKNTYKVLATKKGEVCLIKELKIKNYPISFTCNKYEYTLKIKNESHLDMNVIPVSDDVKINILNNKNLKEGSIITVSVAKENVSYQYLFKIEKENQSSRNIMDNKKEFILISVLIIGLLYLTIRFILKKRNAKKNN